MPHHKEVYYSLITHQDKDITAVLELGDKFYGGGVPIDHYIIQVEDGTQLETLGPTYSFDIMYNTSLSVNISAHNCAGYSDLRKPIRPSIAMLDFEYSILQWKYCHSTIEVPFYSTDYC